MRALQQVGGDPLIEASIRNNRSIVLARRGDWRGAESDLRRAEEMFIANGHPGRTAMVYQNRGLAATVHGDIPAALAAFDEAAARYRAAGSDPGLLPIERAEALLSVRLLAEARTAATAAVAEYTRRDNAVDLVQARLLLARVALPRTTPSTATTEIDRARRSATRQGRGGWVAMASYLALRARWVDGEHSASALRAGQRAIAALETAGWVGPINDARVIVARIALSLGRRKQARVHLERRRRGASHRAPRTDGPEPGTPPRCCGSTTVTDAAPTPHCERASGSWTASARRWAPPSSGPRRPGTRGNWPTWGSGSRWNPAARIGCCAGRSTNAAGPCGCRRCDHPTTTSRRWI